MVQGLLQYFNRISFGRVLRAIKEMNIMRKCKNKSSTDCNKTGMAIVKKAIDGIVKLLTRICNMCIQMDTFPTVR